MQDSFSKVINPLADRTVRQKLVKKVERTMKPKRTKVSNKRSIKRVRKN